MTADDVKLAAFAITLTQIFFRRTSRAACNYEVLSNLLVGSFGSGRGEMVWRSSEARILF